MVLVTDQSDLPRIAHPGVRYLVSIRLQQLSGLEEPTTEVIVVEPEDTAAALEQEVGFPILTSLFDEAPFDHSDYTPPFEIMEEHHYEQYRFYELFNVASDSGAGTAIFIPDQEGIDANLLALCQTWATHAVSTP